MDTDTHTRRMPREDEGREEVMALGSEVHQQLPANHQKLGKGHGTDYHRLQKEKLR